MDEEILPDNECIEFLTTHSYIKNFSPHNILDDYNYKIPLPNFFIYCVGIIDQQRVVQCIRILKKTPSDKISSMLIEWYHLQNGVWEKVEFWVNSGVCLKKQFFLFQDKLNFFKAAYLYYPEMQKYYRLSCFLDYLDIEEVNPFGVIIYNSPNKIRTFKKEIIKTKEKTNGRKEKELKKVLGKVLNKNVDRYLEKNYPHLFHEIVRIIDK